MRTECQHPQKRHYPDRISALLAIAEIQRRGRAVKEARRTYECCARGWCLTTKPLRRKK